MSHTTDLGAHFDAMSHEYDALIARTFPWYHEAFDTLFTFIDLPEDAPLRVLELGVGTGNLTRRVLDAYPRAQVTGVDLSGEMLAVAAHKLNSPQFTPVEIGFMGADFPAESFDLIVSSIALHHLPNDQKPLLYERAYRWLAPGGKFRCLDGHYTLPQSFAHEKVWDGWIAAVRPLGATDAEIEMWRDHERQYDHFVPLSQHFAWLQAAGFSAVDCYWKKLLWGIWGGEKPA